MRSYLVVLGLGVLLTACADKKADFEKAEYLVGKGGAASGVKAEELVTPYLDSADLLTKVKANRLYAGAKVAETGLKPSRIVSRIVKRDESAGTIATLQSAFEGLEDGPAIRGYLTEAINQLNTLRADSDFAAITSSSSAELVREKRGIYYGLGMSYLLYALILGTVDSQLLTLDASDFATLCDQNLTDADLAAFTTYARNARVQFINAGLNDIEQKTQALTESSLVVAGIDTAIANFTEADSKNNSLNDFVDNIQKTVDADFDGDPGTNSDTFTLDEFCDYLKSEKN